MEKSFFLKALDLPSLYLRMLGRCLSVAKNYPHKFSSVGKIFLEKFVNNIFVTYRDVVFFYHFHYAFQSSCSIANLFRVKTARIVKKSRV